MTSGTGRPQRGDPSCVCPPVKWGVGSRAKQKQNQPKLIHIHQPSPIEARDEGLNGHAPVKVCSGLTSTVYVLCVCVGQATGADFIKGYMIKASALIYCRKIRSFYKGKNMFWSNPIV